MIISSVTHTGRKNSRIRDFGPLPKEQPANDTSSLHQDKPGTDASRGLRVLWVSVT